MSPTIDGVDWARGKWPARADEILTQLPPGTIELARASLGRGLRAAGGMPGQSGIASTEGVAGQILAPILLDSEWPLPGEPLPVGGGFVNADLTDDDHETFARLRSSFCDAADRRRPVPVISAEALASRAQEWRLPVTPYREPDSTWLDGISEQEHRPPTPQRSNRRDTPTVIDLTALWAGPLATSLLAALGANVIKIDSDARPDMLGEHDRVYQHLNQAKTIIDLDLRVDADRGRFEELLAQADLLIDSFSRRVMPNLGYGPTELAERFPRLCSLSIVAFPAGCPEAEWVSYGPGVHAISGLGRKGHDGRCRPAPIAYPDPLAGFQAFAIAAEMLSGHRDSTRAEVSLAEAVAPLVASATT